MMRALIYMSLVGLLVLPNLAALQARADDFDENTQTVCHGTRCVGSSCSLDGDATNCWQESVYRRKGKEEVHWICTKHGHHCRWVVGPIPDDDRFGVVHLSTN